MFDFFENMQNLCIFLFNLPQIQILPQDPGSRDPNILWTLHMWRMQTTWTKILQEIGLVAESIKRWDLGIQDPEEGFGFEEG